MTDSGHDVNDQVTRVSDYTTDSECLERCLQVSGASGCERISSDGAVGCYVHHSPDIDHGNGAFGHYCWVFDDPVQGAFIRATH